jgi:hypothetical protein
MAFVCGLGLPRLDQLAPLFSFRDGSLDDVSEALRTLKPPPHSLKSSLLSRCKSSRFIRILNQQLI